MRIAAIRLSERSFAKYYDPAENELTVGDVCIVEDSQLTEVPGRVVMFETRSAWQMRTATFPRVLRAATDEEAKNYDTLREREIEALGMCKDLAQTMNLGMKIFSVRFDDIRRRVVYQFTAENRVDFRLLVKELATRLKARIELWQVGVRDESRQLKGFGICGRELCCGSWIKEFKPVSIRHAKDQDLTLSPSKLAGQCGRLRCCLVYEHETYRDFQKDMPSVGDKVRLVSGIEAVVADRYLLKGAISVADEQGAMKVYPVSDIAEIVGRSNWIPPVRLEAPVIEEGEAPISALEDRDDEARAHANAEPVTARSVSADAPAKRWERKERQPRPERERPGGAGAHRRFGADRTGAGGAARPAAGASAADARRGDDTKRGDDAKRGDDTKRGDENKRGDESKRGDENRRGDESRRGGESRRGDSRRRDESRKRGEARPATEAGSTAGAAAGGSSEGGRDSASRGSSSADRFEVRPREEGAPAAGGGANQPRESRRGGEDRSRSRGRDRSQRGRDRDRTRPADGSMNAPASGPSGDRPNKPAATSDSPARAEGERSGQGERAGQGERPGQGERGESRRSKPRRRGPRRPSGEGGSGGNAGGGSPGGAGGGSAPSAPSGE